MKLTALDMMKYRYKIFIVLLLWFHCHMQAQTKKEYEVRIDVTAFPDTAMAVLRAVPLKEKRLKYFKETNHDKVSYEAKFKFNRKRYSVEFNEAGQLEDIEITIKKSEIPKTALTAIEQYLNAHCDSHHFIKIQKQYPQTEPFTAQQVLKNALQNNNNGAVNFEIEVDLMTRKKHTAMEYLFNAKGSLLSQRIIEPASYQHVLY